MQVKKKKNTEENAQETRRTKNSEKKISCRKNFSNKQLQIQ